LLGSHTVPPDGLGIVLRDASAFSIHHPEVVLRTGVPLLGGHPIPSKGLGLILRDAEAIFVHPPKVVFRTGKILLGGHTIPTKGLGLILRDAATFSIHYPEVVLRQGVSLLGGHPIPTKGFGLILRDAEAKGNDKGKVEGIVGYARRNFMVPVPRFASWDAFNADLEAQCRKRQNEILRGHKETIGERLQRDLAAMKPLPGAPFEACAQASGQVSSQSLVRYETNDYSVQRRTRPLAT